MNTNEEQNERFEYTYAAPTERERKKIEQIRKTYLPQEKKRTDLERLQELDRKVQHPPTLLALTLGVVGTLVFGLGLTCILEWQKLALGAVLSLVGIVPVALAYPLYRLWLEKRKRKYSAEILSLSEKMLHR